MAIMVTIRFDVDVEHDDAVVATMPEVMDRIVEIGDRYGAKYIMRLKRPGQFIDFDEFPDVASYVAFKAEAQDLIDDYESKAGINSIDEVWDIVVAPGEATGPQHGRVQ